MLSSIRSNRRSGVVHDADSIASWILGKTAPELVLPQLVQQRLSIDLGFIDGWHTFDQPVVELYFMHKMLRVPTNLWSFLVDVRSVSGVEVQRARGVRRLWVPDIRGVGANAGDDRAGSASLDCEPAAGKPARSSSMPARTTVS